jgi:hypothetical protein
VSADVTFLDDCDYLYVCKNWEQIFLVESHLVVMVVAGAPVLTPNLLLRLVCLESIFFVHRCRSNFGSVVLED